MLKTAQIKMLLRNFKEGSGYHAKKGQTELDVVITNITRAQIGRSVRDVRLEVRTAGGEPNIKRLRSAFDPVEITDGLSMRVARNQAHTGRAVRLAILNNGYRLEWQEYGT